MKIKIALLVTILAASMFEAGCASTENNVAKPIIGDSWIGQEIAENTKYGFSLKRVAGKGKDQFMGKYTLPNGTLGADVNFTLISIQRFNGTKMRIVTIQREAGHVYRGKLTEDGTSIIEGTRGDALGNTVENPKFSRTKWELHLEKPKAK